MSQRWKTTFVAEEALWRIQNICFTSLQGSWDVFVKRRKANVLCPPKRLFRHEGSGNLTAVQHGCGCACTGVLRLGPELGAQRTCQALAVTAEAPAEP
ncbi:hypothetical protein WJX75_002630 [Coccomyxa subellipsoidea]|uniref:Uncharacterized protein n=1 Tax=Coccomyxa subellipsoidea TaxID=248742 RepID=A0ABR2YZB2_9CHLO